MKDIIIRQNQNIEKFCTAVFLVLDNSKVDDVMKVEIQKETMSIIKLIAMLNIDTHRKDRPMSFIKDIMVHIDMVLSLTSFLSKTKKIESERFEILAEAGTYIKDKMTKMESFMKDAGELSLMVKNIKDTDLEMIADPKVHVDTPKEKFVKKVSNVARVKSVVTNDSDRKAEILKILSNVPVSIKDISSRIDNCSEKTIQRELNSLVDLKKVSKFGEKRWSRYALYAH